MQAASTASAATTASLTALITAQAALISTLTSNVTSLSSKVATLTSGFCPPAAAADVTCWR